MDKDTQRPFHQYLGIYLYLYSLLFVGWLIVFVSLRWLLFLFYFLKQLTTLMTLFPRHSLKEATGKWSALVLSGTWRSLLISSRLSFVCVCVCVWICVLLIFSCLFFFLFFFYFLLPWSVWTAWQPVRKVVCVHFLDDRLSQRNLLFFFSTLKISGGFLFFLFRLNLYIYIYIYILILELHRSGSILLTEYRWA